MLFRSLVWNDRLVQGAPSSPRVYGIVIYKMSSELFGFLHKSSLEGGDYRLSIYADNILFSSTKEIPLNIRERAVEIVEENGFIVHKARRKLLYCAPSTGYSPEGLGLRLSPGGKLTIRPSQINTFRATLTRLSKLEVWHTVKKNRDDKLPIKVAAGIVNYVYRV